MSNNVYQSEFTGSEMDGRLTAVAALQEAVSALETAVAAKYTKPDNGIPATDLDAAVQNALALALTAVQSLADYYTKAQVDAIAAAIAAAVNSTSGVTVTTLPTASADTLGKIYYVGPDGNGEYARKVTSYDGTTYSWLDLGTTAIDLTQYATKAELSQLDQKIDDLSQEYEQNATPDYVIGSMSTSGVADTSSSYGHFAPIELKDGHTIHLNMGEPFYHGFNVSCLYKTDAQGNFVQNLISGSGTVAESYKNESGTTMYVGVSAYTADLGYYITGPADKATDLLSSIYGWIVSEAFTVSSASYTDGTINSPVSVVWPDNYPGTLTIVRDSDGNVSSITATHGTDSFVLSVTRDANGNVTKTEIN